jgi:type IV secretory pathway VirB9-like protein
MRRFYLLPAVLLAGCASQPPPPPPIITVAPPPRKQIVIPPDPLASLMPDVQTAIKSNQTPTLREGIATIYPYSPNQSWMVYCTPLSATEIRLNPDETTDKDSVVLGDSLRWAIKVSRQAVMVEPLGTTADPHMVTNLIIATSRRSYHFQLRLRSKAMTAIAFYYPEDIRQLEQARQLAQAEAAKETAEAPAVAPTPSTPVTPAAVSAVTSQQQEAQATK